MSKKDEEMKAMFENFEGDKGGFEDMSGDTQSIPFIKLLQALSPQVNKADEEHIEGAEPGMLYNTITNTLYPMPMKFVVGKFERYYIEWKPERGGFNGAHAVELVEKRIGVDLVIDDGYKITNPSNGNEFTDTYVYYVIMPDHMEEGVCVLSMTSSQLKEAKKLNRNLRSTMIPGTAQRALPFFMIWNYEVVGKKNDKGSWFGPKFTLDSFVTQDLLTHVTQERKELPSKPVDFALLEDKTSEVKDDDVPY